MQSSGGLISPDSARDFPVRIIESGPAAGILMCAIVGKAEGREHVITFDMGGTTAKLGAVDGGKPAIMPTFEVDLVRYKKGSGLPINVPAVEMVEIGAGGGSIARNDKGMIVVGPDSAGADPGPICYGRGGGSPPSPMPTWCWGTSRPTGSTAGAMQLDKGRPPRHQARDRGPARVSRRSRRPGASTWSPPPTWRMRCASSRWSAGAIPAATPWWLLVARTAARGPAGARGRHSDGHRALWRRRRLRHRAAGGRAAHRRHRSPGSCGSMRSSGSEIAAV